MKGDVSQKEFVDLYKKEREMYESWGNFVADYIRKKIKEKYINLDRILKIPISVRTKDIESLVEKAFYRNKNYKDLYNEITDKVGIRFVVMHSGQLELICKIVEECSLWSESKDSDFHLSRENHPEVFSYESIHYVVRNTEKRKIDKYEIPKGTPCEIQIRTLEQHAYAEISHDLFYKKEKRDNAEISRYLARTAAFNEESDELFKMIYEKVEEDNVNYETIMSELLKKYSLLSLQSDKLNRAVYDNISILIKKYKITGKQVIKFIEDNNFILKDIERQNENLLFKQPVILLLYYLVENYIHELDDIWDFPEDMLTPIKCDLGKSFD